MATFGSTIPPRTYHYEGTEQFTRHQFYNKLVKVLLRIGMVRQAIVGPPATNLTAFAGSDDTAQANWDILGQRVDVLAFPTDETFDVVREFSGVNYTLQFKPCVIVSMSCSGDTASNTNNDSENNIVVFMGAFPVSDAGPLRYARGFSFGDIITANELSAAMGSTGFQANNHMYNISRWGTSSSTTAIQAGRTGLIAFQANWQPATTGSWGSRTGMLVTRYWDVHLGPAGLHIMVGAGQSADDSRFGIMNGMFMFYGDRFPNRARTPSQDINLRTVSPVIESSLKVSTGSQPILYTLYVRHIDYLADSTKSVYSPRYDSFVNQEQVAVSIYTFRGLNYRISDVGVYPNAANWLLVDAESPTVLSGQGRHLMDRLVFFPTNGAETGIGQRRATNVAWWQDGVNFSLVRTAWEDLFTANFARICDRLIPLGHRTDPDTGRVWRTIPHEGNNVRFTFDVTGNTYYSTIPTWLYSTTQTFTYDFTSVGVTPSHHSPDVVGNPPVLVNGVGGASASTELVTNGGFESGLTGWTTTAGSPATAPYPIDAFSLNGGGSKYIYATLNALATVRQTITGISTHVGKSFILSAALGGYRTQADAASVSCEFFTAGDVSLGATTLGPVTPTDRANITTLVSRAAIGVVPAGASYAVLTVTMTPGLGPDVDAYADNISLRIIGASTISAPPVTSDIAVHYDASNTARLNAIGGVVLAVQPQTTGPIAYQPTASNRPILTTVNSLTALDFGPFRDYVAGTFAQGRWFNLPVAVNIQHAFIVVGPSVPGTGIGWPLGHNSTYEWHRGGSGGEPGGGAADPWGNNTNMALTLRNAGGGVFHLNGTAGNPTTVAPTPGVVLISHATGGSTVPVSRFFNDRDQYRSGGGVLCEVILYTRALNATERQLVEGYLAHKWGIQSSLPGGHPYQASPPATNTVQTNTVMPSEIWVVHGNEGTGGVAWSRLAGTDEWEAQVSANGQSPYMELYFEPPAGTDARYRFRLQLDIRVRGGPENDAANRMYFKQHAPHRPDLFQEMIADTEVRSAGSNTGHQNYNFRTITLTSELLSRPNVGLGRLYVRIGLVKSNTATGSGLPVIARIRNIRIIADRLLTEPG